MRTKEIYKQEPCCSCYYLSCDGIGHKKIIFCDLDEKPDKCKEYQHYLFYQPQSLKKEECHVN